MEDVESQYDVRSEPNKTSFSRILHVYYMKHLQYIFPSIRKEMVPFFVSMINLFLKRQRRLRVLCKREEIWKNIWWRFLHAWLFHAENLRGKSSEIVSGARPHITMTLVGKSVFMVTAFRNIKYHCGSRSLIKGKVSLKIFVNIGEIDMDVEKERGCKRDFR